MANFVTTLSLLHLLSALPCLVYGVNVLAVLPSVWKSHYLFGRRLLQQLVETQTNYSVTLISPHAQEYPVQKNIREIHIEGLLENWEETGLPFDVEQARLSSILEHFTRLMYAGASNVDILLGDEKFRRLVNSGEEFDLLVVDLFLSDSLLCLAHFYQIPTVVISPTGANTWLNQMIGNPQSSALDPSIFLPYSERMNIWQRSVNTLMGLFEKLTYNFFYMISHEAVYRKHFQTLNHLADTNLPHHRDLTKNLSLVLINSHPIVQYPRAYLPNVLEIAGAHLHGVPQQIELPAHIAYFIETAPAGAVYISLGADARTVDLAREKLDELVDVMSYLTNYNFLLKWEDRKFYTDLPKNVMIADWWPQEAILAHLKVKVFISACGLMSIIESINGLTPILAIPIFPDQEVNARRLKKLGIALTHSFDTIEFTPIMNKIIELATNPNYGLQVTEKRKLLNSNFGTPMARSIHYIDLILNSAGGGDFLKSHANELNFMRAELVDVLAIIFLGLFVIIAVPFSVTCCILRRSYINQTALKAQVGVQRATLRVTGHTNSTSGVAAVNDSPVLDWHRRSSATKAAGVLKPPSSPSASSTTSTVSATSTASSAASSVRGSPRPRSSGSGADGSGDSAIKREKFARQAAMKSPSQ
ncbi:UDP-glycosyltransferase UGT4-like [Rhagoletis pomonella]|uniref:UDP-glycosyltransferase UGT4-like n=1 Tax=Rhagoletis pomonella TaxID=28610 RepID=UPI00177F1E1A|nr:UDP-glycosyltransferase UGT4-like [Rhagoletis pomonella]